MSPEAVIALMGIVIALIAGLAGALYASLRAEDKRLARNIHSLRNLVQAVIMTLASRGIKVPKSNDD